MRYVYLIMFSVVLLAAGCATPDLHAKCLHVETQTVAETSERYAVRDLLDVTNRLEKWTDPLPLEPEHLYTAEISKLPDKIPHVKIRVHRFYTHLIFFNDPENPDDDETINLKTSDALTDALADIGEYKLPEKPGK